MELKEEVVPGLTYGEMVKMADSVMGWTDGNHPRTGRSENRFIDILQNGKPNISASPVFVQKITE